jgi:hypothetical protein
MPSPSVTNPGVSINVPPTRIRAPSASSLAGIRPLLMAVVKACHARRPSRRMSQPPRMLSAISSKIVHQGPITWPTWIST